MCAHIMVQIHELRLNSCISFSKLQNIIIYLSDVGGDESDLPVGKVAEKTQEELKEEGLVKIVQEPASQDKKTEKPKKKKKEVIVEVKEVEVDDDFLEQHLSSVKEVVSTLKEEPEVEKKDPNHLDLKIQIDESNHNLDHSFEHVHSPAINVINERNEWHLEVKENEATEDFEPIIPAHIEKHHINPDDFNNEEDTKEAFKPLSSPEKPSKPNDNDHLSPDEVNENASNNSEDGANDNIEADAKVVQQDDSNNEIQDKNANDAPQEDAESVENDADNAKSDEIHAAQSEVAQPKTEAENPVNNDEAPAAADNEQEQENNDENNNELASEEADGQDDGQGDEQEDEVALKSEPEEDAQNDQQPNDSQNVVEELKGEDAPQVVNSHSHEEAKQSSDHLNDLVGDDQTPQVTNETAEEIDTADVNKEIVVDENKEADEGESPKRQTESSEPHAPHDPDEPQDPIDEEEDDAAEELEEIKSPNQPEESAVPVHPTEIDTPQPSLDEDAKDDKAAIISQRTKLWRQKVEGMIDSAKQLKHEGNDFFKNGDYKKAKSKYTRLFAFTKAFSSCYPYSGDMHINKAMRDEENKEQFEKLAEENKGLERDANNNLAIIFLKEENWAKSIEKSTLSINIDK